MTKGDTRQGDTGLTVSLDYLEVSSGLVEIYS